MNRKTILLSASAGALLVGAQAMAGPQYSPQYDPRYDERYDRSEVIRCESRDGRTQRCSTGGRDARLVRQLSSTPCVEGRSWGRDRDGVWVGMGCRADFALTGYQGGSGVGQRTFRCESQDGRYRMCNAESRGRARLVRQLSDTPCIEGRTWGANRAGVWVDRGCRAEFSAGRGWGGGDWSGQYPGDGYGQIVRCESNDDRTRRCDVGVQSGVELTRQLSTSQCVQGRTWGWDRGGVWVSRGCRAEFRVY